MGVPALALLYCGLRRGELLALLWSEVILLGRRFLQRTMYVCPAMRTGDIMSAQAYTEAWSSYMHYLNLCAGGRDKVRTKNENGKVCFIPAVQAMEPFTAHQLRHSYATILYDADVDVKTAQKLLGHADFSVTMKIYRQNCFKFGGDRNSICSHFYA